LPLPPPDEELLEPPQPAATRQMPSTASAVRTSGRTLASVLIREYLRIEGKSAQRPGAGRREGGIITQKPVEFRPFLPDREETALEVSFFLSPQAFTNAWLARYWTRLFAPNEEVPR
jgi:hypothetical protein